MRKLALYLIITTLFLLFIGCHSRKHTCPAYHNGSVENIVLKSENKA